MARPQQEQLTPKQQVLSDLEDARASLALHATLAAEEWSPRALVRRSMEKHRALWIGGAALAGLALVKLIWPAGDANNRGDNFMAAAKNRGWLALLLSPLLALGRKAVLNYGSQLFESYLRHKVSPNDPDAETV
jgi:hypothetical protein